MGNLTLLAWKIPYTAGEDKPHLWQLKVMHTSTTAAMGVKPRKQTNKTYYPVSFHVGVLQFVSWRAPHANSLLRLAMPPLLSGNLLLGDKLLVTLNYAHCPVASYCHPPSPAVPQDTIFLLNNMHQKAKRNPHALCCCTFAEQEILDRRNTAFPSTTHSSFLGFSVRPLLACVLPRWAENNTNYSWWNQKVQLWVHKLLMKEIISNEQDYWITNSAFKSPTGVPIYK